MSLTMVLQAAVFVFLFIAGHTARLPDAHKLVLPGQEVQQQGIADFASWAAFYGKSYSEEEHEQRADVFNQNLRIIAEHNAQNSDFELSLNEFADLTWEEFSQTHLGVLPGGSFAQSGANPGGLFPAPRPAYAHACSAPANTSFSHSDKRVPDSIDWRERGAVTPVKNQAACGSCWAFSTTGSIEGINAIKTGQLVSLSEQELVDCDTAQDMGCSGGLMDYAFKFVEKHGLDTESDYAYWGMSTYCNQLKEDRDVVTIDGYEDVPAGDEEALLKAVGQQPISVAICADSSLQFYSKGVVTGKCCESLNHGVLLVGVEEEAGQKHLIIKNSWSEAWGEKGYFRLASVGGKGMCGITQAASYPLKTHPNPKDLPNICGWWGRSECKAGTQCQCNFDLLPMLDLPQYTCIDWGCA